MLKFPYACMPRLFRVYTRVHMYFSVYAIKIIKKYIKIPYFRAGLMVTLVVQPPQHVANCFQLTETTLRKYKNPSCAWPKGGEKFYRHYTQLESQFKSNSPCLLHFPRFIFGNPYFLEMFIHLYAISSAQVLEES